jgi:hypothetical protein
MELHRFRWLLDAYGADLARWPQAERDAAQALLHRSREAAEAQRETAELDRLMRRPAPVPSAASVERLVARLDITKAGMRRPALWQQLTLLAAVAVLGFAAGWLGPVPEDVSLHRDNIVNLVFDGDRAGGADL